MRTIKSVAAGVVLLVAAVAAIPAATVAAVVLVPVVGLWLLGQSMRPKSDAGPGLLAGLAALVQKKTPGDDSPGAQLAD